MRVATLGSLASLTPLAFARGFTWLTTLRPASRSARPASRSANGIRARSVAPRALSALEKGKRLPDFPHKGPKDLTADDLKNIAYYFKLENGDYTLHTKLDGVPGATRVKDPAVLKSLTDKVKDPRLLEDLLTKAKDDPVLLGRLLDSTKDPSRLNKLLDAAGDGARLEKLIKDVGDLAKLEMLLAKIGSGDALSRLLKVLTKNELETLADNVTNAERLILMLDHIEPSTAAGMLRKSIAKSHFKKLNEFLERMSKGVGNELAEKSPVGANAIIIDSNTAIALVKDADPALRATMHSGEIGRVAYIKALPKGTEIRVGSVAVGETGGKVAAKGLPLDVAGLR